MPGTQKAKYQVWALLFMEEGSERKLRDFFVNDCRVPAKCVRRDLHATIYHARRELVGLAESVDTVRIRVPGTELRLMVMAPGGENPRPDLDPAHRSVGIRIRRANGATKDIEELRALFYRHETPDVLGSRAPSSRRRNAFGARHFQPHITVLRPGSLVDRDLTKPGAKLREVIDEVVFDRLVIRCRQSVE